MSASDKKKLRKEQAAAVVTEKQRTEQKKQKKLTAYTVTFIVAMVLVLAIFLTTVLKSPIQNTGIRLSTAVTINDHKVSGTQFNYFYVDSVRNFCSQFSSYGDYAAMIMQMYGFDPTTALGDQVQNQETGATWADYFADSAIESAKWTYAMYDEAMAKGFKLTDEQTKSIADYEAALKAQADTAGISANKYIQNNYGSVASLKSYMEFYELTAIATLYASEYYDSIEFKPEDLREHEKDKYNDYSSYAYATYTVNVSEYLTGGTKETDEDGKTTTVYSDEEKKAAQEAALVDAKALIANESIVDVDTFNLAIAALKKSVTTCTEVAETLYTDLSISNEDMKKWVTDDAREAGDLNYFTNSTTTDGTETVNSYTVVMFLNCNDNTSYEGSVLHLLVAFEGGTTDSTTNTTTYSDAEKKAAKDEAEKLLAEFEAGEQTKEAFIALLTEHTDDVDSEKKPNNGGLYEDITPASNYVQAFKDWAYADHKPGDTGIIETEYGYHIMYYVEDGEHTYRDLLIEADLTEAAYTEWEEAILAAAKVVESKKVKVNEDFVVPTSYYSSSSYSTY